MSVVVGRWVFEVFASLRISAYFGVIRSLSNEPPNLFNLRRSSFEARLLRSSIELVEKSFIFYLSVNW